MRNHLAMASFSFGYDNEAAVLHALRKTPGVRAVKVNCVIGKVSVTFDPGSLAPEELQAIVSHPERICGKKPSFQLRERAYLDFGGISV